MTDIKAKYRIKSSNQPDFLYGRGQAKRCYCTNEVIVSRLTKIREK